MCGIAGIVTSSGLPIPHEIKMMTDSISHRGPDAEGFLLASDACRLVGCQFEHSDFTPLYALGHRRLSIIDLEGGVQPLCNEDGTVWIVFNGEIYNHMDLRKDLETRGHLFKTNHSDTETIVHAYEEWGIGGFDRFNGIFAFGILDLNKKKLILARDHFGVKPLYHYFDKERFVFCSEIKGILQCGGVQRQLNPRGLSEYLSFRYVPSPDTMFDNIFKIEAGAFLVVDLRNFRISEAGTYCCRETVIDHDKGFRQWVEEYREHFERAVARQLLSDVEIGALLSGGVDSSAVCSLAVRLLGHPIRTYTVGFRDFPEGNELEEASSYAKSLGTIHKNVVIDNDDFVKVLEEVAWFMDEPTATSSVIPLYYLTKEIKKDVKVVLTGQGADEPLAGYPRYCGERAYTTGFRHLGFLQPVVEMLPRMERLKRAFRSFREDDAYCRFLKVYHLFSDEQKGRLLKGPATEGGAILLKKLFDEYHADDSLGRMLYMDTRAWLSDDLLIYGDKATMINSIEARVPILDKDLVHFIESIPSRYKLSLLLKGKYVHKEACKKWLPPVVVNRPKKGFQTPIDKWFRSVLGGYVRGQLLDGRFARGLFKVSFVEEMIEKHRTGKEDYQRHLFSLLMLEKWAEAFNVSI